jgi:hypothetical protein
MLDNNIIDLATNSKYSEFSTSIKSELKNKLASNEVYKEYSKELLEIQELKSKFAEINSIDSIGEK